METTFCRFLAVANNPLLSFQFCSPKFANNQQPESPNITQKVTKRVQTTAMTEIENRYKALIQPIKDIAANWDIDIAESLTEYLEDLDNLRISIDGGKSNLNFAEAALLIQGSTAVYSKKVEYLHQLVLQSLEFITNKKSTNGAAAQGGKTTKAVDDDDILFLDNDASFLLLDHIVEEGHNINLKTSVPNLADRRNSRNSVSYAVRTSPARNAFPHQSTRLFCRRTRSLARTTRPACRCL